MKHFLNRHKTKLTGLLLVVAGALQANSVALQSLLSAKGYAWFTVAVGLFVAVLGFINQRPEPSPDTHDDGTSGESQ